MRRSVGSGPMPQADTAAAPALVTPRTFKKRLRSSESVISVMAHAAVAGDVVLHVTTDAPPHAERRDLGNLRRMLHVAVAGDTRVGAEGLDVTHMGETHEPGQRVDAYPFRRFPLPPRVAHLLDFGLMRRRGSTDQLMAAHTCLERRDAGLARDRRRVVTVHARDLVLAGMDVVAEKNRLARSLEFAGVAGAENGSLIPSSLLAVQGHRRQGEDKHHDRS